MKPDRKLFRLAPAALAACALLVGCTADPVKEQRYREGQDALRPVLTEDPQHREAQRLQRRIDEKLVKPAVATVPLRSSLTKPLTLELRDVTLRSVFDILSRASGITFVLDK